MLSIYNYKLLKSLAIVAFPIYVLGVLYFTLMWRSSGFLGIYEMNLNIVPFFWLIEPLFLGKDFYLNQVVLNVLMFVPFGLLLPLVLISYNLKKVIALSFISTTTIEFIQPFFGRCTDVDDILLNMAGAFLGYIIMRKIENLIIKAFCKKRTIYLSAYVSCISNSSKNVA